MQKVIAIFRNEFTYFSKRIRDNVRRLFFSNIFRSAADPFITIFLNAFIWHETASIASVSLFNLGQYIFLPIAFLANGYILRKISVRRALALGAALTAASSLLVAIGAMVAPSAIPVFACILGFGSGIYWANRNQVEFLETEATLRPYFYSLLSSISSLINIVLPLLAGWFIVIGPKIGWYSEQSAYWILFGISFIFLGFAASAIVGGTSASAVPAKIWRPFREPSWNPRRVLQIAAGLLDGIGYLPTLLVLYLLGNEGILGSITAVSALVTMLALYIFGRNFQLHHEKASLGASAFLYVLAAILLAFLPTSLGIILFLLAYRAAASFSSVITNSIFFRLSEEEMAGREEERYSFIFDNELFLNIGRILAVFALMGIVRITGGPAGLARAPVLIALLHGALVAIYFCMIKYRPRRQAAAQVV